MVNAPARDQLWLINVSTIPLHQQPKPSPPKKNNQAMERSQCGLLRNTPGPPKGTSPSHFLGLAANIHFPGHTNNNDWDWMGWTMFGGTCLIWWNLEYPMLLEDVCCMIYFGKLSIFPVTAVGSLLGATRCHLSHFISAASQGTKSDELRSIKMWYFQPTPLSKR